MPSIRDRQNDSVLLDMLRANHVAHAKAQRLDVFRLSIAAAIAAAGLTATYLPSAAAPVAVLGASWAIVYTSGLAAWSRSALRLAATLQEMFDTRLLAMRWNAVLAGKPVPAHDVNRLAKQFRGREDLIRDYYEIPDLPPPYDVVACLLQNLGWGARVHRRYAHLSISIAALLVAMGAVLAIVNNLSVLDLISRWYVPALGLLLLCIDNWWTHRSVADDRERTLALLNERVDESLQPPGKTQDLLPLAREVQDMLLLTRLRAPRVPGYFFLRFHGDDREDFRVAMEALKARLDGGVGP